MNKQQLDRLLKLKRPKVLTGTADIDISAAVYTGYIPLLAIQAPSEYGLDDLIIELDYDKETTGWNAVATDADTMATAVARKVDGTNYRRVTYGSTATAGATMVTTGQRFNVGAVAPGEIVQIQVVESAERGDVEIPYRITYKSEGVPTVTPIAAG